MNSAEYFEKNKYVVLQNALSKEQCDQLTKHMFNLYEQKQLIKDEQCPLSDAVYGDPVFDNLLEKFTSPIGNSVGKVLIPTYSYARIYRPGETLKKHVDRPSCEISATLTLGYEGKSVWPIFFDDDLEIPVELQVGELAVYKGCEITHWRPEFKGNWHVQVFLHYVDANGPFKEFALDKRESLGSKTKRSNLDPNNDSSVIEQDKPNDTNGALTKNSVYAQGIVFRSNKISNDYPGYISFNSKNMPHLAFTNEECDRIISLTKDIYPTSAAVGGSDRGNIVKQIRSASIYNIDPTEETAWIFDKLAKSVMFSNDNYFDFDIHGINHSLQLIEYSADSKIPGHYNWHVDCGPGESSTRKISYVAQLSDSKDYDGCELIINNVGEEITATKERGSIHLFPSYFLHKVEPIKRGTRYSLVIWIHGPKRFR